MNKHPGDKAFEEEVEGVEAKKEFDMNSFFAQEMSKKIEKQKLEVMKIEDVRANRVVRELPPKEACVNLIETLASNNSISLNQSYKGESIYSKEFNGVMKYSACFTYGFEVDEHEKRKTKQAWIQIFGRGVQLQFVHDKETHYVDLGIIRPE